MNSSHPTAHNMPWMYVHQQQKMGPHPPQGPPPSLVTNSPVLESSGQLSNFNPAIHNLSYPGMRDGLNHPIQQQSQTQHQQQQRPSQFSNSPVIHNQVQQATNQGLQHQQQPPLYEQSPPQRTNKNETKTSPSGCYQLDDNRNSYNEETFGPLFRTYHKTGDQAIKRDPISGYVHTLGILRHPL